MEIIDLVRKSSGVTMGVVNVEKDLAADLKAFSDAVRFDLNADLRLGKPVSLSGLGPCKFCGCWKTLKSRSSKSMSGWDKGSPKLPSLPSD